MLYFSTLDSIELLSDEELGRFIKTEMRWLSGQSEEPQYEEIGSKFLHCRIKEQMIVRDRNAKYKQDSRQKEDKQSEYEVSVYTDTAYNNLSDKAKQFIKYCGEDWNKIEQLSKKIWEKDDYDKDLNTQLNTLVSKYAEPFGMDDDSDEWEELKTYLFVKA